jgi:RNA polymerase sigma factor (sigma-70 family)
MTPHEDPETPTARTGHGPGGVGQESWSDRCARLFGELRRPARAMVTRAYGRSLSDDEIEDVYSAAWAATLAALRDRGARMEESELRAYILTAVASHASKEMRRRSRKPAQPLEVAPERSTIDGNAALPDELAIGSETRGIARDLLTSLPVRRRAVMLLRYGWGLSPKEVCALVPGLSPRAYRKEITRGVEELIEALGKVESGEWCQDRERLIRDLVAGTADESSRRQAIEHLNHCRACSDLATRLSQQLHEIGSLIALSGVAGCIGGGLPLLQRFGEAIGGIKGAVVNAAEKAESAATTLLASGGAKGSGAAGAGVVAKLAGAGTATKAVAACIGAGAAATACVAAGVVPGISLPDLDPKLERRPLAAIARPSSGEARKPRVAIASVVRVSRAVDAEGTSSDPQGSPGPTPAAPPPPAPEAPPVEQPVSPPPVQEFDPVAASAPAPTPAPEPSGSSGGSAGSIAESEFGP